MGDGKMADLRILDLDEKLEQLWDDNNKEKLHVIMEEFKRRHYPNVLSKMEQVKEVSPDHPQLHRLLMIIAAVCHAQMNELKTATILINQLYEQPDAHDSDELLILGELAYMTDFKLARRILSEAIRRLDEEQYTGAEQYARGYIALAGAEEQLQKYIRSIKYYKQALAYHEKQDTDDIQMRVHLLFKIGSLSVEVGKLEEAVEYLNQSIELAGEELLDVKINGLVQTAKVYGSLQKSELVHTYLKEALGRIGESTLEGTRTHAEALVEMGYLYFETPSYDEAVPYYQEAIQIFNQIHHPSSREMGMIQMQYAFCLANMERPRHAEATKQFEVAIQWLERTNNRQLLENALIDVIDYFERKKDQKNKRIYEQKLVKLVNG
ncbi:tetratricopeptide repeat protein [Ornithinibacillus gellani]|nr:tetratricopeptide repeat protein [Ornithinibacillus gellani]